MTFETFLIETEGPIGYLTLNRPKRMNALAPTVLRELVAKCHKHWKKIGLYPSSYCAIVPQDVSP